MCSGLTIIVFFLLNLKIRLHWPSRPWAHTGENIQVDGLHPRCEKKHDDIMINPSIKRKVEVSGHSSGVGR